MALSTLLRLPLLLTAVLPATGQPASDPKPRPPRSEYFDVRESLPPGPRLDVSLLEPPPPRDGLRRSGPAGETVQAAREFLRGAVPLFASGRARVEDFRAQVQALPDGASNVTLRQYIRGIPVFEGRVDVAVGGDGRVWLANAGALAPEDALFATTPAVSAEDAIRAALRSVNEADPPLNRLPDTVEGLTFENPKGARVRSPRS